MSTSQRIMELLEQGYSPSEIVKMGYPRSTVYYVYRRYKNARIGPIRTIYVAHDTGRFERLTRLKEILESLGYHVIVGPWDMAWDVRRTLRDVDIVVGIADARPSMRHLLFTREIEEARRLGKKTIIIAEKGATIRATPHVVILTYSNDPRELQQSLKKLLDKLGSGNRDLVTVIGAIAIAAIAAIGIAALFNLIVSFLESKS